MLPRRQGLSPRKPGKATDIVPGRTVWVDYDSTDLHRLTDFTPPPSIVVSSGNHYYGFWLLDHPYSPEQIERANRGIARALETDSHTNPAFTLRLPHSWNLKAIDPHNYTIKELRSKRKRCKIIQDGWHPERRYNIEELPSAEYLQPKLRYQGVRYPHHIQSAKEQVYDNFQLLRLIQGMDPHVQRMIARGEVFDPKTGTTVKKQKGERWETDRSELAMALIVQLNNYGWTPERLFDLLTSGLPLKGVTLFQEKYEGREEEQFNSIIDKVSFKEEPRGNAEPRLLDITSQFRDRKQIFIDSEPQPDVEEEDSAKPALHRLATFAHGLYTNPRQGHYLAALPMGYGKTREFVIPFVIHCAKHDSNTGIIIAMERRADVKTYAAEVNGKVGKDVASALFSHDPDACPKDCSTHHTEYREQASQFPMLFLTHEMLSRHGVEQYQGWHGGQRVMCLIDEKPAAWWGKGEITEQDLLTLHEQLHQLEPRQASAIRAVLRETFAMLTAAADGATVTLQTTFNRQQIYPLSCQLQITEDLQERLRTTLENLYALSQTGGVVVKTTDDEAEDEDLGGTQIIVSRQRLLPAMPTLILDATGAFDPEYANEIELLAISPWEGTTVNEHTFPPLHLMTCTRTISKQTLSQDKKAWDLLIERIQHVLTLPHLQGERVYIVVSKKHEDMLKQKLQSCLSPDNFNRLLFKHYGETKGSNTMQDAAAIIFASVQFKQTGYYRAVALATGKGDVTADTVTIDHSVRRFRDPDLEAVKVKDTVVTLLQEIGRTRIRKAEKQPIWVFLPWADKQGVAALKQQLGLQFLARVEHQVEQVKEPTKQDQLLTLLHTPGSYSKQELMEAVDVSEAGLREILNREAVKKRLWGREIQRTDDALIVPDGTWTDAILQAAELWCWHEFLQANTGERTNTNQRAIDSGEIPIDTLLGKVYEAIERGE